MIPPLRHILGWIVSALSSRESLILENLALRPQLLALHSKRPRRRLAAVHKLFWVMLSKVWSGWKGRLLLVTPRKVIGWHRASFRLSGRGSQEQESGRSKTCQRGNSDSHLPHGCRESNLGSAT